MANEIWTIKRCLEWTKEYLAERGEEHPRLSAEWLLCAATGLARIDLYMRMDETLNAAQLETMHAAVVRRAKGEPLQYITGSTQFRMIDVACAPGVLIPRPETEMLVEEVLNYLDAEVLSPEAAARQRVELPWNDEVEEARKAEAALADERATAERRAANLTAADEGDELFPAAVEVVLETGQASVSMLQRRLKLGYSRAARLVDQMEDRGVVGPFEGSKPRQLLITRAQWQEMQMGGQGEEEPPFPVEE